MKAWLLSGLLLGHSHLAMAVAPDAWKELTFSYQESNANLGQLFKVFSQAMGVKTQVNFPGLLDKVVMGGQSISGTPVQVLDRLGFAYRFQWYVYRNVLYISDYSADGVEHIRMKGATPPQAKQALIGVGLFENKFGWSELERGSRSAVVVSGPPSYLLLVKGILNRLSVVDPENEERRVMMFPLKYASAMDVEIPTREGNVVRPGVTTMLKKLLTSRYPTIGDGGGDIVRGEGGLRISRSLSSLSSAGGESTNNPIALPSVSNPFGEAKSLNTSSEEQREDEPIIEAYAALNAVMIKDRPSRRAIYEGLFNSLDVPAKRVELIVTIVDVDVSTLDEWMPQISIGGVKNRVNVNPLSGLDISSTGNIVLVSTNNFAIALKNSESTGHARIHSRPSVMTLDNLSAVLDLSQTAYFKLLGERTADVKSVTIGTRLKVTPRVLGGEPSASMHVQIELEDGALQEFNQSGELTQSRSSFIGTQAIIEPGQSLLIGGYRRDANEKANSQIPYFSKLPAIGNFFKSESNKTQRVERLFVLSARIVAGDIPSVKEQVRNLQQDVVIE